MKAPDAARADTSWLLTAVASPSVLTDWVWARAAEPAAPIVRIVRGPKMRSIASLADELSAALQFPWYFGGTFDAIEECLTDLDWLPGPAYVLAIADADELLADAAKEDLEAFLALLARVHAFWAGGGAPVSARAPETVPFTVVLHARATSDDALRRRLASSGIVAGEMSIP